MNSIILLKPLIILLLTTLLLTLSINLKANSAIAKAEQYYTDQLWQQAIDEFKKLLKNDNSNPQLWLRLGQSLVNLEQYQAAIPAFHSAIDNKKETFPLAQALLGLARSYAAINDSKNAIKYIELISTTKAHPYLAVKNSSQFSTLNELEEYQMALEKLKPCNSDNHRAFDFWLGEWEVTTPSRKNWTAISSITLANDGCSVHENYVSQSGYTGKSINFYDRNKKMWHQSWMDNTGAAIYLEGTTKEGAMILTDATNRVTWSLLEDKRVRQHWETTSDEGKTWSTSFDGYYLKK
jgi:tetratricopeptide (TPR) repeat protein